jgi:DNA-binding CsgD family transcriptional regulator
VLRQHLEVTALKARYDSLSRREREVMNLVVTGRLNKQVGGDLGISEYTVKAHRRKVMRKMRAVTYGELINMVAGLRAQLLNLGPQPLPPQTASTSTMVQSHSKAAFDVIGVGTPSHSTFQET